MIAGAEFCLHCQDWCLPLGDHGTCGFCDRVPASGFLVIPEDDPVAVQMELFRQGKVAA